MPTLRFAQAAASVALLVPSAAATPQADIAWQRTFESGTTDHAFPTAAAVLPGGDVVLAWATAAASGQPSQAEAWLARFDREGAELWRRMAPNPYGHSGGYRDVVPCPDGGTFSLLWQTVQKHDAAGTLEWSRPAGHVVALPDGGCAVTDSAGVLTSSVTRYDPSGAQVWSHPLMGETRTLEADSLGNVVAFGYNDLFHSNQPLPVLAARISFAGDLASTSCYLASCIHDGPRWFEDEHVWNHLFAVGGSALVDARAHVTMFLGDAFGASWEVHSFDRIGGRTWSLLSQNVAWSAYPEAAAVEPTGHVWMAGRSGPNFEEIGAARVDPLGNVEWSFVMPLPAGSMVQRVYSVELDPRGGAYVHGVLQSPQGGQPFVLALDTAGGASLSELPTTSLGGNFNGWQRTSLAVDQDGRVVHAQPVATGGGIGARFTSWVRGGQQGAAVCGAAVVNSTGQPGSLVALGTDVVTENRLTLVVADLPGTSLTLFLTGTAHQAVTSVPNSQGTLCVSGDIGRFLRPGELRFADDAGRASVQLDLVSLPSSSLGAVAAQVGETRVFQAWYRDANPTPTSNFTSSVAVTFR
ncbi:MAG: hypothetical protein R3F49_17240 [Planctomycetota bacterium]